MTNWERETAEKLVSVWENSSKEGYGDVAACLREQCVPLLAVAQELQNDLDNARRVAVYVTAAYQNHQGITSEVLACVGSWSAERGGMRLNERMARWDARVQSKRVLAEIRDRQGR